MQFPSGWSGPGLVHQPQSIWSGILAPLLTIFKPYRGIIFGFEMACIWTPTTYPHASSAGNGTGLRQHSGDPNPWMVSTDKGIFSPVPSGRRHCLQCRWGPVARPQQTAGSMSPRMHNCHDFLCLQYSVFFYYFFFYNVQYWGGLFSFLVVWKCASWKCAFWINSENQRLQCFI